MGKANPLPSQEYLRKCFSYDEKHGFLIWRERDDMLLPWNARWAGKPAFTAINGTGYKRGHLDGIGYLAHRIIWKLVNGSEPETIDHINGDKTDNRISNLRSVTQAENQHNQKRPKTNKSGTVGVSRAGPNGWRARVQINGKEKHLGSFASLDAAVEARNGAAQEYGYHPNHGRTG